MATEATAAATVASEGASAGLGALSAAGVAVKAFVLANPVPIAAVAAVIIGVVAYRAVTHRGQKPEEVQEAHEEGAEPAAA